MITNCIFKKTLSLTTEMIACGYGFMKAGDCGCQKRASGLLEPESLVILTLSMLGTDLRSSAKFITAPSHCFISLVPGFIYITNTMCSFFYNNKHGLIFKSCALY